VTLVEGAFDRLALLSGGMKAGEVVALAGTAIRPDWFPAHVSEVILALDADAGGEQASQRLFERLERAGIHAESCPPPQDSWGKDWSERWRTMGVASMVPLFEMRSSRQFGMQAQKQGA
jgi:DNA primase